MKIKKITIRNYKCFEQVSLTPHPNFNLFVGGNGSGKSALLEVASLSIAVSCVGQITSKARTKFPKTDDVRSITLNNQQKPQLPLVIECDSTVFEKTTNIKYTINQELSAEVKAPDKKIISLIKSKVRESRKIGSVLFPLFAYYGTGRLWGEDHKAIEFQKQGEGILMAYPDCLVPDTTSKAFLSWYKTLDDEVRKFNKESDLLFLKVINDAVSSMIPGWESMAFSHAKDDIVGILDGEFRYFHQLSDGYRNTIGMVADMVYRCIQLNPHLGENILKETNGIVLIDEIDLHLHPVWQSNIISNLLRIFPKVQFFATTHSPIVVANYAKGKLFVIEKDHSIGICSEKYFGKEVNLVLNNILHATDRHIATQEKLDLLFNMIEEELPIEKFQDLLNNLEELLGIEDKEIQKARSLIAWNKYKKENPDAIHT
jgi:predicted ATP-binding protein involved in virulence